MAKDTEHFKVSEFTCKCGCGKDDIDQRIIDMAETIRQALGVPVRVNSGCRCKEHNARSKGVPNSKHLTGKAADLSCSLGSAKCLRPSRSYTRKENCRNSITASSLRWQA